MYSQPSHCSLFSARQKSKGTKDVLWLKTVLSSGTLGDKVAALTLLIQESPFHTLTSLDSLLAMASKKGKRESILAIGEANNIERSIPKGLLVWGFSEYFAPEKINSGTYVLRCSWHCM